MRNSECGVRNCWERDSALRTPQSAFQWGFTLVELILVSVVLGILLAASAPRFQQTAQRMRAEQAAFECAQLLRLAHERAVAEGRDVIWAWDPYARRVQLYRVMTAGPTESIEAIDEPTARSEPFLPGLRMRLDHAGAAPCPDGVAAEGACVRLFADGTSEATTLTLDAPARAYVITVHETTSRISLTAGPPAS